MSSDQFPSSEHLSPASSVLCNCDLCIRRHRSVMESYILNIDRDGDISIYRRNNNIENSADNNIHPIEFTEP